MFEKFVKILAIALLFSAVLYCGFLSTLLVAIGGDYMKLKTYEIVGFSIITGLAFLFPLSQIFKVLWREMK